MKNYQIEGSITIHQPLFLPWLPMIARLASSEMFVPLDNVQFREKYLQNRTQIVLLRGAGKNDQKWISLNTRATYRDLFRDATIRDAEVVDTVINALKSNYSHTHFFAEIWAAIEEVLRDAQRNSKSILDTNIALLKVLFELLDLKFPEMVLASSLYTGTNRNERIATICSRLGKTYNLYGCGKSKDVHDLDYLREHKVHLIGLDRDEVFEKLPLIYRRNYVSILHPLFIKGPDEVRKNIECVCGMYQHGIDKEKQGISLQKV